MLTNPISIAVVQVIFDHILTESGVSNRVANKIRKKFGRERLELAYQVALMRAYKHFARQHPQWAAAFFDEHFLKKHAAPLLARCLPPANPPEPREIAIAWAEQMNAASESDVAKATQVAEDFLNELRKQLRAREEFRGLFDSIDIESTAIATRQTADAMQALHAELKQLLTELAIQQPASVTITQNIIMSNVNVEELSKMASLGQTSKDFTPLLPAATPTSPLLTNRKDEHHPISPPISSGREDKNSHLPQPATSWAISGLLSQVSNHLTKPLARLRAALVRRAPAESTRLFICYQQNVEKDSQLADYLYHFLTEQGHKVFMDKQMPTEIIGNEPIEDQIKRSKFLIVLLSQESVHSEMVQEKVRRAYEYRKLQEQPRTLAVRIAYEERLPDTIDAFLDPLQYVSWQSSTDNERVVQEILAAIEGRVTTRRPVQPPYRPRKVVTGEHSLQAKVEPTPNEMMYDKFYIKRAADARFKHEIVKKGGTLTTIRAARQTGKTSLLVQGVHHARQNRIKVVNLDLLRMERAYLQTSEHFYRYLAEFIVWELGFDIDQVERLWRGRRGRGSQDKLSRVLTYVLSESDQPIMLAMDDVDRLLETDFHTDFFALVRSWHNRRGFDERWRKLNLVLVISTEPHLLIADTNQSPFNVGQRIELKDFNVAQVRYLNQRYGSPVRESEMAEMMNLLNGHPYLTRQALDTLTTESLSWSELTEMAVSEPGPFAEHLRRYYWLLRDKHDLKAALKQVIQKKRCPDDITFYRLLRAGLITGNNESSCVCRCDLYRMYFEDKF